MFYRIKINVLNKNYKNICTVSSKKNPNAIYCQKAPYPFCRELCWAFSPNLGGGARKKAKGGKKGKE
jgi:hypothetical protein